MLTHPYNDHFLSFSLNTYRHQLLGSRNEAPHLYEMTGPRAAVQSIVFPVVTRQNPRACPQNLQIWFAFFIVNIVYSLYVFNVYHTWNIHNIYYLHITIYMKWYIHMYCIYGCIYTYKLKKKFTNLTALTWYDLNWIDWTWHALNLLNLLHMTLPVPRGVSWPILAAAGNSDVVVNATDVGRNFCITIVNRLKQGIPPTWIGIAKLISLINIWNISSCWLSQVNHMIQ